MFELHVACGKEPQSLQGPITNAHMMLRFTGLWRPLLCRIPPVAVSDGPASEQQSISLSLNFMDIESYVNNIPRNLDFLLQACYT